MKALISTIPRSGTNLIYYFLIYLDYFVCQNGCPAENIAFEYVNSKFGSNKFPSIGFEEITVAHAFCPGHRELFKNHPLRDKYLELPESPDWFDSAGRWVNKNISILSPALCPQPKVAFIYRNPLDFFASMSLHVVHHNARMDNQEFEMDKFINSVTPLYLHSYLSFIEMERAYPGKIVLVRYEDLISNRRKNIKNILLHLGIQWDKKLEKAFTAALDFTTIEKLKKYEKFSGKTLARDQKTTKDNTHMRSGLKSIWRNHLTSRQVDMIKKLFDHWELDLHSFID